MFTGIVEDLQRVHALDRASDEVWRLVVSYDSPESSPAELGASIAINGVCLTVAELSKNRVGFDLVQSTLRSTNLGKLSAGDLVNFERSLTFGKEIGGHILSGHVSGTATVTYSEPVDQSMKLGLEFPGDLIKYITNRGFIALNGASLTIYDLDRTKCTGEVMLIPSTLEATNLDLVEKGDGLNLEIDSTTQAVVDTVERLLQDEAWRSEYLSQVSGSD